jgi:tetratricopeptide (TPR) repeat protein
MSGELDPSLEWDFVYLKWLYGEREAAAVRFEELLSQMREAWGEADTDYNYYAAKFHSLAGNKNLAIQHLRRAIDRGFESPEMVVDPELDPLRGDPEFEALAERARTLAATPDYWELAVRRFGNEGPSEAGKYFALAFEWMEREWGRGSPETLFRRAEFHALMGQRDEALVTLRQAAESGFADERVHLDPELDSLRGDPEFDLLANEILPVDQVIGLQTTEDEP